MPKPPSLPAQPQLRALTPFKRLPVDHKTFKVTRDGAEPHLNVGEFAVVDTTDREPQHGELYLIQWSGGSREIVHVKWRHQNVKAPGRSNFEPALVWYVGDLRGFRKIANASIGGSKVFVGTSDGHILRITSERS